MGDFSTVLSNDLLQDLVADFELENLDDHFDDGLLSNQVCKDVFVWGFPTLGCVKLLLRS